MTLSTHLAASQPASQPAQFQSNWKVFRDCWIEAASEFATGTVDFFTTQRVVETDMMLNHLNAHYQTGGLSVLGVQGIYFLGSPPAASGNVISDGVQTFRQSRSSVERWEGSLAIALGALNLLNILAAPALGARVPIARVKLPTFTITNGGAMAIATVEVSVPGMQVANVAGAVAVAGMPGGMGSNVLQMAITKDTGNPPSQSSGGIFSHDAENDRRLSALKDKLGSDKQQAALRVLDIFEEITDEMDRAVNIRTKDARKNPNAQDIPKIMQLVDLLEGVGRLIEQEQLGGVVLRPSSHVFLAGFRQPISLSTGFNFKVLLMDIGIKMISHRG